MEGKLLAELLDFGALGLFAGFLIWLHIKNAARTEEMVEKFQAAIRVQESAHGAAEDLIRTRYDNIIARHESQRMKLHEDISRKLDDHTRSLEEILCGVRSTPYNDPTQTRPDF